MSLGAELIGKPREERGQGFQLAVFDLTVSKLLSCSLYKIVLFCELVCFSSIVILKSLLQCYRGCFGSICASINIETVQSFGRNSGLMSLLYQCKSTHELPWCDFDILWRWSVSCTIGSKNVFISWIYGSWNTTRQLTAHCLYRFSITLQLISGLSLGGWKIYSSLQNLKRLM